jgi:uncharacterized protein DUF4267
VKVARALAGTLAVSRAAFGVNYLLRPEEANRSWIGPVAKVPATQVIIRSQAARDLALGGGALRALARGDDRELRAWMAGQTVADLTDTIATWLARRKLPKRQSRLAMRVAGASTLVGAAAAAGLSRQGRSSEAPSAPRSA